MAKHTPGPWFGMKNSGVTHGSPDGESVFETGCGCCTSADLRQEDADLIAAAPDMLGFAQDLLAAYHSDDGMWEPKTIARVARALIEKATGEQP